MRDARTLLPVELWEHILHQVPNTEDLLTRLASVCTLYNELCIRICLERQGVSTDDLQKPILHLSGAITRPICLLPRSYTFPARQVNSRVDPTQIPSELRRLVRTLERCVNLETLSIALQSDPFQVSQPSRQAVLSGLCELLSEVAARNSAPVFVLVGQDRFSCMPVDISLWKLHEFEFNPPSPDPVYFGALSYTWTRLHTGNATRAQRLASLESVDLSLVEKSASQRALSLLTLNRAPITRLVLGRPEEFVPYLTSMLWHISLPNLRDLNIYTDKIDPAALHHFLVHHPRIENVDVSLPSNDNTISNPLLNATLVHPNIMSLFRARKSRAMCPPHHPLPLRVPPKFALSASRLIHSAPHCTPIVPPRSWPYCIPRVSGTRGIKPIPPRVQVPQRVVRLAGIHLWAALAATPMGPYRRRSGDCCAHAQCSQTHNFTVLMADGLSAPWLAAFPSVTEIKLSLDFETSGEAAFVHAARRALPKVQHISFGTIFL
ncbi:hypothetical protein C8F01DRAFT_475484 [Mycena amicta]|nr:hypothetical protein C8F01DRAFT_475484 [Mycena amicta]